MNLSLSRLLTGVALAGSIAFVSACSGTALNSPTGPSASVSAATAASSGASFSINPNCELDPSAEGCAPPPPPPPPPPPDGTPCSPGYWKNHLTEFNAYCTAAAAVSGDRFASCGDLLTALTCRGSDASCGRNEAAGVLNGVSACVED